MITLFKSHNVDLLGLEINKSKKTFFWSGKYRKDMNVRDTIETQLNVLISFNPVVPKKHLSTDFVMLGNVMPSVQLQVLNQFNKKPKLLAMDTMNLWIENEYNDLIQEQYISGGVGFVTQVIGFEFGFRQNLTDKKDNLFSFNLRAYLP